MQKEYNYTIKHKNQKERQINMEEIKLTEEQEKEFSNGKGEQDE